MQQNFLDQPLLDLGNDVHAASRDFCRGILIVGSRAGGKSPSRGAPIWAALASSEANAFDHAPPATEPNLPMPNRGIDR